MAEQPTPENRTVAGRYELRGELGRGGMGIVWRGWDTELEREVALKEVLLPDELTEEEAADARARLRRESRTAARLADHPNVVTLYDVFEVDSAPWVVMQLVRGRSLQDAMRADGPLSAAAATPVAEGLLNALESAHQAGILHRDVKPGNVMLADDGRVLLTDFGIATIEGDSAITRTGILGSPEYIAPERFETSEVGPASDLWSLGVTLYTATTGGTPFRRDTMAATVGAVISSQIPPPNAGELTDVIVGLLHRAPGQRLTASGAREMLSSRGSGGLGSPSTPPAGTAPSRPPMVVPSGPQTPPEPYPGSPAGGGPPPGAPSGAHMAWHGAPPGHPAGQHAPAGPLATAGAPGMPGQQGPSGPHPAAVLSVPPGSQGPPGHHPGPPQGYLGSAPGPQGAAHMRPAPAHGQGASSRRRTVLLTALGVGAAVLILITAIIVVPPGGNDGFVSWEDDAVQVDHPEEWTVSLDNVTDYGAEFSHPTSTHGLSFAVAAMDQSSYDAEGLEFSAEEYVQSIEDDIIEDSLEFQQVRLEQANELPNFPDSWDAVAWEATYTVTVPEMVDEGLDEAERFVRWWQVHDHDHNAYFMWWNGPRSMERDYQDAMDRAVESFAALDLDG